MAGCAGCTGGNDEDQKHKSTGEYNPDKALHFSEGKPGVDQIPVEVLLEWGEVFSYGEKKYFRDNWLRGNKFHEFYGSALRHLFAFQMGKDIDPESGLPHLSHALWNIGALRYYQIHGLGTDDRPRHPDLSGLSDDDCPQYIPQEHKPDEGGI